MNETQKKLINATERLLQTKGLARLTTRAIAGEAGVAEGLIYQHFKDKAELVFAVVEQRMNETKNLLDKLPLQVGLREVSENLEEVLQIAYRSHYQIIPIICSVFADHQLHLRILEIINERQLGPQLPIETMAHYLAAEQRLGRIAAEIVPVSAANLIWMVSFNLAMNDQFMGCELNPSIAGEKIHEAIETILIGMKPRIVIPQKKSSKKRKIL
ncbi:MAG: TetR/AcrR family transcriptional regulator [Smithella sp.]